VSDTVSFATFRVAGDRLVPDEITSILQTAPTSAYQKGAKVKFGARSPETAGKTGMWFLSTDRIVSSPNLEDHLRYIFPTVFMPGGDVLRFAAFHDLLKKKSLKAHLTIFWHGPSRGKKPSLPPSFEAMLKAIPADIEVDFDTDEEPAKRRG
jgi:Domain of unknown function (DUF4279)